MPVRTRRSTLTARAARRATATRLPSPATVDAYLAAQSPAMRRELRRIRTIVRAAAPDAVEVISYRVPAFRTDRGVLVWYAGFAAHGSFFPGALTRFPELTRAMKPYAVSRGTLRFTVDRPLPARLITRLVRARLREQADA
jgi:uncharacterized protein YdhG (YjbR/CyaY superfamily)